MLMIVTAYRFLIAVLFVLVVGIVAYVITSGMVADNGLGFLSIAGGMTMFVMVVLAIGATATFISIHDRICEIVTLMENETSGHIDGNA